MAKQILSSLEDPQFSSASFLMVRVEDYMNCKGEWGLEESDIELTACDTDVEGTQDVEVVESALQREVEEGLNGKDSMVEVSVQEKLMEEVAADNWYHYVGVHMAE